MSSPSVAQIAKKTSYEFAKCNEDDRCLAIKEIAVNLTNQMDEILNANKIDVKNAMKEGLTSAMIDRLKLDENNISAIVKGCLAIAAQERVVGKMLESKTRSDGLVIQKEQIPLGVIGMIFESRPNVVIDCSCLAIKSGNCIILKGGKEAIHSNQVLAKIVRSSIEKHIPKDVVQMISSHEEVGELLNQVGLVDVIIPRGGEKLINFVYENSKVPVIAHFKGLCHIFVDESAELESTIKIILNAKTQRPGVCNAVETLLLHQDLPRNFVDDIFQALLDKGTELRICQKTATSIKNVKKTTPSDWETEYLDNILSVKTVASVEDAIQHIQHYGSHHTEAILSKNLKNIELFKSQVDASSIMINASTRFNDGGEYGLGAELGISTTKLHAYGPMGADQMTTSRYVVVGDGHIRN